MKLSNFSIKIALSSPKLLKTLISIILITVCFCNWVIAQKTFFQNTALTSAGNYNPSGVPGNTDDVRITSSGTGLLISSGNVTMRSLTINNGTSYTLNNGSSGSTNRTLTLGNTTSFTNSWSSTSNDIIYVSSGSLDFQGTNNSTGSAVTGLALACNCNINVQSGGSLSIGSGSGGVISGAFSLTKIGGGTLTLASSGNTYTGKTSINEGTIALSGESRLGANPGSFVADQITFNGGGILSTGALNFNSNRGITLSSGGGTFDASGGTITLTNVVTGSGDLTKVNSGILAMAGVHTYTGDTNINGGTLQLSAANRLPSGTAVVLANSASTIFNLNNFNQTIGSLAGGGASGGNVTLGSGTLTVGDASSTTYGGVISGTGGILKQGSGTLTLSRSNTYSGNTTINAGTLEIGANNVLPTVPFILAGGTLSTGSGAGFSETVGTLQLTASSTIALGSGVHTLTFANSSGTTWTAGQTLTITGWTSSAGKIMVGAGGLSTAQLAQVSFTGYAGTGAISNGELVPASSLPIKLISFNATRQNNQAQLTFSTATEENNNFFAIERSGNGTDFRTIGKVNGAGTTTSIQNYSFTDETPLSSINYYRLKQVDFDGQFTYSPVVNVVFDNKAGIRLAPTPVQDQLRVELDEMFQEDAQWQLYDFAGRLVQTGVLSAENMVFNVEVGSLTPGNYVIRVVSGQTTLTKQFQK
ncbi:MAG: autotransporter-associated beta strand repeat-containing protein [Saprospiraceae bacterium]|nr:autotransporter-associated beta strand repeat-containing protein [Saprospiraceae bacterium]